MDWQSILVTGLITFGIPAALYLAKQWVDAHVKDQRMRQWADGALSAAGKAYVLLAQMRQANPTAPLDQLVSQAVTKTANDMMTGYGQTAAAVGATTADAQSRITGELGALLAADPSVSAGAVTVPRPVAA